MFDHQPSPYELVVETARRYDPDHPYGEFWWNINEVGWFKIAARARDRFPDGIKAGDVLVILPRHWSHSFTGRSGIKNFIVDRGQNESIQA